MFPLGSASRGIGALPYVTVLIILINVGAFYLEVERGGEFIIRWAAVPAKIVAGQTLETIITSAFLHAGWLHIIGNMVFLWVFAPPMEAAMGSFKFLMFYLLGAGAAVAVHVYGNQDGVVPVLGASGAVAAVMGAFLVTYPRDAIRTLVLTPIARMVYIPAIIFIALWIVLQVVSATTEPTQANVGGIAYLAHIGGAIFGAAAGRLFLR